MALGRFVEKEKGQILRESKKRAFEKKQKEVKTFTSNQVLNSKPTANTRSSN